MTVGSERTPASISSDRERASNYLCLFIRHLSSVFVKRETTSTLTEIQVMTYMEVLSIFRLLAVDVNGNMDGIAW
jgi:hypothetical protein